MKFIVSEKNTANGLILVITDQDILGKLFTEENKQLDLTKEFYKGKEMDAEEIKKNIKKAYVIHLTGKNAVNLGKELGLVEKMITIKNIPHAEVLLES